MCSPERVAVCSGAKAMATDLRPSVSRSQAAFQAMSAPDVALKSRETTLQK